MPSLRSKRAAAVAATVVLAALAGVYAFALAPASSTYSVSFEDAAGPPARPSVTADAAAQLPAPLLVRAVEPGAPNGDGALYELSPEGEVRRVGGSLACRRVHRSPAGPALCIRVAANGFDYEALILDADLDRRARIRVDGVPSRARVSPDGRYGAYTTFTGEGQGYFNDTGEFSTATRIVDMRTGERLVALEDLEVSRDGRAVDLAGAELWGVTFGDGGRFYATLAIGTDQMLLAGRVGSTSARIVGDNVECPALSPDGTRIAYKRRLGDTGIWHLHVRDLRTGRDIALSGPRTFDDQPEWIGDDLVAYGRGTAVYATRADGTGDPVRIADDAASPASLPR